MAIDPYDLNELKRIHATHELKTERTPTPERDLRLMFSESEWHDLEEAAQIEGTSVGKVVMKWILEGLGTI